MVSRISLPPARPSPSRLQSLPAKEQWDHISQHPRFLRPWFSLSLTIDVIITAVVYIWGWSAAGQPWLVSVPAFGHVVVVTGVLFAVHVHGPIPHATILCPACTLLKLYIVICPFMQQAQNRPWGSASLHIISGTISTFLMHFACVVSTESWQARPHRLLDARLDVALSGMAAVCRHLDNTASMDAGIILFDRATGEACMSGLYSVCGTIWRLACVQLTLSSIEMLLSIILSCGGKFMAGANSRILRFRVAVYSMSLLCEAGLICNIITEWRLLPTTGTSAVMAPAGDAHGKDLYSTAAGSLAVNRTAHIAISATLTVAVFAANVYGLRRSLQALAKLRARVGRLLRPGKGAAAAALNIDIAAASRAERERAAAQSLRAWRSLEHASLCVNGSMEIVDLHSHTGPHSQLRPENRSVPYRRHSWSLASLQPIASPSTRSASARFALPRGFDFLVRERETPKSGNSGICKQPGSSGHASSRASLDARSGATVTCPASDGGTSQGTSQASQRGRPSSLETWRAGLATLERSQVGGGEMRGRCAAMSTPSRCGRHSSAGFLAHGVCPPDGVPAARLSDAAPADGGLRQSAISIELHLTGGSRNRAGRWESGVPVGTSSLVHNRAFDPCSCSGAESLQCSRHEHSVSSCNAHDRGEDVQCSNALVAVSSFVTDNADGDVRFSSKVMPLATVPAGALLAAGGHSRDHTRARDVTHAAAVTRGDSSASSDLEQGFLRDGGLDVRNPPHNGAASLRCAAGMLLQRMWQAQQELAGDMDASVGPWPAHSHMPGQRLPFTLLDRRSDGRPAAGPDLGPQQPGPHGCLQRLLRQPAGASTTGGETGVGTAATSHECNILSLDLSAGSDLQGRPL